MKSSPVYAKWLEIVSGQVRVWLDDYRSAPEGWIWLKSVDDLCSLLKISALVDGKEVPLVSEVSLDNDLGEGYAEGHTVLDWIEGNYKDLPGIPEISIHTQDPIAKEYMLKVLERLKLLRDSAERVSYR